MLRQYLYYVTILTNKLHFIPINVIGTPLTFNAFYEVKEEDREDVLLVIKQRLSQESEDAIVSFLK
jgi:hypothetical protein